MIRGLKVVGDDCTDDAGWDDCTGDEEVETLYFGESRKASSATALGASEEVEMVKEFSASDTIALEISG